MTKRERVEDLGVLKIMLQEILDNDIFTHTESKHGYEQWVKENHDKIEYEEPRGLDHIFFKIRGLRYDLETLLAIAAGDEE